MCVCVGVLVLVDIYTCTHLKKDDKKKIIKQMLLPVKNAGTYSIMKTCAQTTHPTIQWSKKKLIFNSTFFVHINTTDTQICAHIPPERSSINSSTSLSHALSFFTNSFLLSLFLSLLSRFLFLTTLSPMALLSLQPLRWHQYPLCGGHGSGHWPAHWYNK